MKFLSRPLCAVVVFLLPLVGRAASPAAADAADSATNAPQTQAAGQDTAAKPPVIHVQSNLVLVDVVVTKHGAPVKGLTKDKFRVLENGKEQELKVFDEHTETQQATVVKAPELPPNTYSDFSPYSPSNAVTVLLLDALNTQATDQAKVRTDMLAYLKKIPPGTRMAVFTLSSRLRMIQGFSADPSVLAKAITKKGDIAQSIATDNHSNDAMEEVVYDMVQGGGATDDAIEVQQFAADLQSFNTAQQEQITVDAMRQIAHYLSAIPGRKNLIWFSGSFPLNLDPVAPDSRIPLKDSTTGDSVGDPRNPNSVNTIRDFAAEVRETDRLLTAARIAVYPVDAHGLVSMQSSFDASTSQASVLGLAAALGPAAQTRQITNAQMQAAAQIQSGDDTIEQIAADTGGKAFVKTNGFEDAIKQALADGANYYTVGYVPQGNDDGQFRHIKVKLDGGYELDYRDGYYADTPGHGANSGATTMKEAVQFGAPPPSEIPLQGAGHLFNGPSCAGLHAGLRPGGRGRQSPEASGHALPDRLHGGRAPLCLPEDAGRRGAGAAGVHRAGLQR